MFKWYEKYFVVKWKTAEKALNKDDFEKLKDIKKKMLDYYRQRFDETTNQSEFKEYIVISRKETKLFEVVKKLVELFSTAE